MDSVSSLEVIRGMIDVSPADITAVKSLQIDMVIEPPVSHITTVKTYRVSGPMAHAANRPCVQSPWYFPAGSIFDTHAASLPATTPIGRLQYPRGQPTVSSYPTREEMQATYIDLDALNI